MKKNLLEKVKADYKKRGDKNYNFLYTLYDLIPYGLKDKLIYNDDDSLYFGEKYICDLEELSEVTDWSDLDESFDRTIHLSKNDEKDFMCIWFFHRKDSEGHWSFKEFQVGDWDYINIEDNIAPVKEGEMPF